MNVQHDGKLVLSVRKLSISFQQKNHRVQVVNNFSLDVKQGETIAIVGESGSGKSVTSLALIRLIEHVGGKIDSGHIWLTQRHNQQQVDLVHLSQSQIRRIRGVDIAMIFQEPMTSLNPVFPVGEQIAESIRLHQGKDHTAALVEAKHMLDLVCIPEAKNVLACYPHQLSGGMRQRVMIAMALSCRPVLLIADEPTTALDVTIQAQILKLIRILQKEIHMGVIFITHNMGVVAEMADQVQVMYQGNVVETGRVDSIFTAPQQDYTRALLAAVPQLGTMRGRPLPARFPLIQADEQQEEEQLQDTVHQQDQPILQVRDLVTRFNICSGIFNRVRQQVHAVEKVSFDLRLGETLALVGESGCGKSTIGRSLLRLVKIQDGCILLNGERIDQLSNKALLRRRRDIQCIFQDAYTSLNPRLTVGLSIMEPLLVHKMEQGQENKRVIELLERVGLRSEHAYLYPHEFSGGQRQRICIARALALNPKVVIADEAVSALDVSIQAKIINLMLDLQREYGISFLFISHDIAVVERISHRVAVMYRGQIVEIGSRQAVFEHPKHPYTCKLMAAVPVANPEHLRRKKALLMDEILDPIRMIDEEPQISTLIKVGKDHFVAQHTAT